MCRVTKKEDNGHKSLESSPRRSKVVTKSNKNSVCIIYFDKYKHLWERPTIKFAQRLHI